MKCSCQNNKIILFRPSTHPKEKMFGFQLTEPCKTFCIFKFQNPIQNWPHCCSGSRDIRLLYLGLYSEAYQPNNLNQTENRFEEKFEPTINISLTHHSPISNFLLWNTSRFVFCRINLIPSLSHSELSPLPRAWVYCLLTLFDVVCCQNSE